MEGRESVVLKRRVVVVVVDLCYSKMKEISNLK